MLIYDTPIAQRCRQPSSLLKSYLFWQSSTKGSSASTRRSTSFTDSSNHSITAASLHRLQVLPTYSAVSSARAGGCLETEGRLSSLSKGRSEVRIKIKAVKNVAAKTLLLCDVDGYTTLDDKVYHAILMSWSFHGINSSVCNTSDNKGSQHYPI